MSSMAPGALLEANAQPVAEEVDPEAAEEARYNEAMRWREEQHQQ